MKEPGVVVWVSGPAEDTTARVATPELGRDPIVVSSRHRFARDIPRSRAGLDVFLFLHPANGSSK